MLFFDHDETIQHLFLECPLAKLLWRTIHIAVNINPPVDIESLFGTWLTGVEHTTVARIRIGIFALLWDICNCQNDLIFNRQYTHSYGL